MTDAPQETGLLGGKRVLLIAPIFFGYEREIEAALKRVGAEVDRLPDRPFNSPFLKAVTRFRRDLVLPAAERFFRSAIAAFGRTHYDLVLVVQGEGLSPRWLRELRGLFPQARFAWYLWDSLRNKSALKPNLDCFDRCFTFDAQDARAFGMTFRPLFFAPGFEQEGSGPFEYDLSFIGTVHSDRYRIVNNVFSALPGGARTYAHLFLQAPWMFWLQKAANPAFRAARYERIAFHSLPPTEVQRVFTLSRVVLDIEHPRQTGLTMRTFETLGARKKLLTTNRLVLETDFFRAENIVLIERDAPPVFPPGFFETPYVPLPEPVYRKYSLDGWVRDVAASG